MEELRNVSFIPEKRRIPTALSKNREHLSVIYICRGNRKINRHPVGCGDQMPSKPKERSETFRSTVS